MKISLLIAALVLLALGIWAFWLEPSSFVVANTALTLKKWPKECDNLKVVLLSDLHVGSPHNGIENLQKVVAATNTIHPDLILLAGDFVIHEVIGGNFVEPDAIAHELQELKAKSGVYAVLGNHDWWYSASKVKNALTEVKIPLLENKAVSIRQGQCQFWLAGIGDYWLGHHDFYKAIHTIPAAATIIAFTHNPDVFYEIPPDIAITFAGHTHGGQVNLPGLGRMIVPSRYGEKLAAGLISEGGRNLFVTSGIGTSILPVRFRVPPEIAVVTLHHQP